jgi:predicted HTH transcriptional regulator
MTDAVFNAENLREDVDLEAKSALGQDGRGALPKDLFESYSAFANTDGGMIYLGVKELKDRSFDAHGIENPDPVLDDLWNQLNNPQKVSRNLLTPAMVRRFPSASGRWVIEIEVPRATRHERPIFINGNPLKGTYKRHHAGDYLCREDEVKRMLAEQTEDARDARLLPGYTFDDLDMDSFKAYRNRMAALKPDHPFNGAENLEFLRKLGGWRKDRQTGEEGLTLAGLLMFGKHEAIHEVVPNYFVDYRELPVGGTKTKWVDRLSPDGTWSGNLYDFYRMTIQRLFRDLKVPFRLEGGEREDDTPVHKALREALVNSLVHADYSARISILVVKAPVYFGFRNPGKMRIPIEKALEGGHSDCRNRSLQKMFSLIGLGEQAGSGIPRVLENWKSQHYRFPELW